MAGYVGPRCEVCNVTDHSEWFDTVEARCLGCGNISATVASLFFSCVFLSAVVPVIVVKYCRTCTSSSKQRSRMRMKALRVIHLGQKYRKRMRFKVKVLVGLYQCIAAAPE
eukprot:1694842-Prymnesium_polylepis.2